MKTHAVMPNHTRTHGIQSQAATRSIKIIIMLRDKYRVSVCQCIIDAEEAPSQSVVLCKYY